VVEDGSLPLQISCGFSAQQRSCALRCACVLKLRLMKNLSTVKKEQKIKQAKKNPRKMERMEIGKFGNNYPCLIPIHVYP